MTRAMVDLESVKGSTTASDFILLKESVNPIFDCVKEALPDPILGIQVAFERDTSPNKVNLGVGAYRTEEGKPFVFSSVREAQVTLANRSDLDKEYLPIDGLASLKLPCQILIFHETSGLIKEGRIATVQTISGTGALRVAAEFVAANLSGPRLAYISSPSWSNHRNVFTAAGFEVKAYQYWDELSRGIKFQEMMEDLSSVPENSLIILHTCAHNPTGNDLSVPQWIEVLDLVKHRKLIPIFDTAYQGFASGDLEADVKAIRLAQERNLSMIVTQSFAKNMGLYGERVGMLHLVCGSQSQAKSVLSQLKIIIRRMYSSPPSWGARILNEVLNNPALCILWKQELRSVAARIQSIRLQLRSRLEALGTPGNWEHITNQIGMFSYTGLTVAQCERLTSLWHIYLLKNGGRISLAGLNSKNLDYVATAIDDCVRHTSHSNM